MEILILRHGIADDAEAGRADSARQLTAEGRQKTAAVARTARLSGAVPTLILSSPFARAVQTAEIAAAEFGYAGEILRTRALVPESTPEAVWNEVREYRRETSLLLTGHEPLFSQLVAYLLSSPTLRVGMKKSAMVRVDLEITSGSPRGVLRWMITPALTGAANASV